MIIEQPFRDSQPRKVHSKYICCREGIKKYRMVISHCPHRSQVPDKKGHWI